MQAVILAGGFGTRLASVVHDVPKPMAPIGGVPFLDYIINQLENNGFDDFILLTGYKSEIIETHYRKSGNIKCVKENIPLGTGGAIINALEFLSDEFYVINGDTFFDIDFKLLSEFSSGKEACIALRFATDIARYGYVDFDEDFRISRFIEKSRLEKDKVDGYINGGIYYFKKTLFQNLISGSFDKPFSVENDFFPELIKDKKLFGLPVGGLFIDIGIPEDYIRAQEVIPEWIQKPRMPALFVDKDGTLIEDTGYPHGSVIKPLDSIIPFLTMYKKAGYYIVMVTNQAGIAKNKFSYNEALENIDATILFYAKFGIDFDHVEFCPYHVEGVIPKYTFFSRLRKPEAGMLLRACENLRIDLGNSLMVGDNPDTDRIKLPYLKFMHIGEI